MGSFSQLSFLVYSILPISDKENGTRRVLEISYKGKQLLNLLIGLNRYRFQSSHPLSSPSPPALIFPSIKVFSSKSFLRIRWPKDGSFSFSISPSNEHSGLFSFRVCWICLQSKGLSRVFSNTTVQKHQFFSTQLSLQSNSHVQT